MPLPPGWIESAEAIKPGLGTIKVYTDIESGIKIPYHPSSPFIFNFLDEMREYYKNHPEEAIVTHLKNVRKDESNTTKLSKEIETEHLMYKRLLANYFNTDIIRRRHKRLAHKKKQYLLQRNRYIYRSKRPIGKEVKTERENKKPLVPKGVVTDMELIEVADQAGLDLEKDIHLFMVIEEVIL